MKYFIGGEDLKEADSGSGADDVTDVLRNFNVTRIHDPTEQ